MAGKSYKVIEAQATAEDALDFARSELEDVAAELQDWWDNLQGTPLETGSKAELLEEAVQTLENATSELESITLEDASAADIELSYHHATPRTKSRGPSRQVRIENAASALNAVADALSDARDAEQSEDATDEERVEELEAMIETLQEVAENVESIEVPGMYG